MIEVAVARLGLDAGTNAHVVVLQERDGTRHLPIWIGRPEAEAIALHLQQVKRERPMTHDLLRALLVALQGVLRRVQVVREHQGTYFAELHVLREGELVTVDARPSDAIALALRCHAPIFVHETLLRAEEGPGDAEPMPPPEPGDEPLEDYLRRLGPEDFGKFTP